MKKRIFAIGMTMLMMAVAFTGCGGNAEGESTGASGSISVVSREDGSGTRGAFVELFGIEQKDANGEKVDMTTTSAEITNSTAVMMTTIAGNVNSIGYISLGSLNDTVKALQIDGVEASAENIKNGSYKIARPFNVVTKADVSDAAKDFMAFIQSAEGQAIVEENGYISEQNTGEYVPANVSGNVVVAGSSSVSPVMEKLKEAYAQKNSNVTVEIQTNDSTTGISSTAAGGCDIGMASRELKDSELEKGLVPTVIALDGIAIIVHNDNTINEMDSATVKGIFTGEITDWADIIS